MNQQISFFESVKYPDIPGYRLRVTSIAAAKAVEPGLSESKKKILAVLASADMTADEVAAAFGRGILYVRPRIAELVRKGLIEDSSDRRPNASGKMAIVWRVRK